MWPLNSSCAAGGLSRGNVAAAETVLDGRRHSTTCCAARWSQSRSWRKQPRSCRKPYWLLFSLLDYLSGKRSVCRWISHCAAATGRYQSISTPSANCCSRISSTLHDVTSSHCQLISTFRPPRVRSPYLSSTSIFHDCQDRCESPPP